MELAALLIAVAALVLATASVTLQITLFIKQKQKVTEVKPPMQVLDTAFLTSPSPFEMQPRTAAQQILKEQADERLQDAFDNPDAPYTGIDEEFNV